MPVFLVAFDASDPGLDRLRTGPEAVASATKSLICTWRMFGHSVPHAAHPHHLRAIHPQGLDRRSASGSQPDHRRRVMAPREMVCPILQGCKQSRPRGPGLIVLQGVFRSGFENRKLIDSFQQTIELRHFGGLELTLSISGQELVKARRS
jgi:hypothetical protein